LIFYRRDRAKAFQTATTNDHEEEMMMSEMNDIVVVDDNPLLVSVLSEIFREQGYRVRTASDGFSALLAIREQVPDILISDLNMPRMTGFELLSIVRRKYPSIAAIAMSGAYEGAIVPAGVAADGFYAKGASSVARLLEILAAIEDDPTRRSRRVMTPIWIAALCAEMGACPTTAVACPECLRTFAHSLHDVEFKREERSCPHCLHTLELVLVRASTELDSTGPHLLTTPAMVGEAGFPY
jgi:CheY-like chemotaxis protein